MSDIFGYGEDVLTLWVLKNRVNRILDVFNDSTSPKDCLIFYRPSFGRSGGIGSSEFGEFDSIVASKEKYYLIESKWDNHSSYRKESVILRKEQLLRHEVFTWYLHSWDAKYSGNWKLFKLEQEKGLEKFSKTVPRAGSLLAENLESILSQLVGYPNCDSIQRPIRNVLLFFFDGRRSMPPSKTNKGFTIIPFDYRQLSKDNFIAI
jgi:hypothetical protein